MDNTEQIYYSITDYYRDGNKVKSLSFKGLDRVINPAVWGKHHEDSLKSQGVKFANIDGKYINRTHDLSGFDFAVTYLLPYK